MEHKSESNIMRVIQLALSTAGVKIFRNNNGQGWIGKSKLFNSAQTVNVKAGDVLIQAARPLHSGLCVGSSDLIGWKTITVTPEMVGTKIAVFIGCEVKNQSGRATKEQIAFINVLNESGGRGFIARNPEEALKGVGL